MNAQSKHVLIALTSHGTLGDTDKATGFQLVELAEPYYALRDAGHRVTLASIRGGRPPAAPTRDAELAHPAVQLLMADAAAQAPLEDTLPIDRIGSHDFDAIFLPAWRARQGLGFPDEQQIGACGWANVRRRQAHRRRLSRPRQSASGDAR
jgi:hypothetical protein